MVGKQSLPRRIPKQSLGTTKKRRQRFWGLWRVASFSFGGFCLTRVGAKCKFCFRYRGMEIKASAKLRTR